MLGNMGEPLEHGPVADFVGEVSDLATDVEPGLA